MIHIETERLVLRDWKPEDLKPFAAMNQDPVVMEYMPNIYTEAETEAMIQRIQESFRIRGFGLFACELKNTEEMIGYVGLLSPNFEAHFTPCVEIGWRLAKEHWGKGYATEGAKAALHKGFTDYNLDEIVSFTVRDNIRSRRVMEKIGLIHDTDDDFQHPRLAKDHPLSWHVLYRLTKEQYLNTI